MSLDLRSSWRLATVITVASVLGCTEVDSGAVLAVRGDPDAANAGDAAGVDASAVTPDDAAAIDAAPTPLDDAADASLEASTDATVMDAPADDVAVVDGAARDGAAVDGADVAVAVACSINETCNNGVDDNCNGQVDERCVCIPGTTQRCYEGPRAAAGVGACAWGSQRCEGVTEFGVWGPCAGSAAPGGERCDEVDNDCDGVVDDGCACRVDDTQGCYTGPAATRNVGACLDGMQSCRAGADSVGSAWTMCAGETLPADERCDGVDNDCNGTIDDGCSCTAGMTRTCYGGPEGTAGVGRCHGGTQTCASTGSTAAWGSCAGQELPSPERCDGVDNDCDGTVDNGCACTPGDTRDCYSGATGTRGVGACAAGSQRCEEGPGAVGAAWGACTGERLPASERCDDIDNNCDGAIDEVCACRRDETQRCYPGPAGTSGVGVCAAGVQRCVVADGAASWGACSGAVLPGRERCDGATDDDCDGVVDNGCACATGATQRCYTGPAGTEGVGACRAGSQRCAVAADGFGSAWGACTDDTLPGVERCDGIDNDCDGTVDDGCACTPTTTQRCYTGPAGTEGVGACRAGSQRCDVGAGGVGSDWGACVGSMLPGVETCNGVDDDCDGVIDEGCACTPGATRSCYGGSTGTAGVGACRAGAQTCVVADGVAGWGACTGDTLPSGERCDGVDNDCDGVVDNGCACTPGATRSCYTGASGTAGVGACRAGSQTCAAGAGGIGSAWGACGGQTLPAAERCDGVDNDCDGVVDNGCACTPGATRSCYTGPSGTAGVGACANGTQTCAAGAGGVGAAWGTCDGQTTPSAEVCDRVDNNCNGAVDDGLSCGPSVVCPAAVTELAGTTVTLRASATGATRYQWTVVSGASVSAVTLGSPTSVSTTFTSVIVGAYAVRFTATDAAGRSASCDTMVTLVGHGLRVELTWNTGTGTASGRTDIDLHMHNAAATAWFTSPNDCYYRNTAPSWNASGTADDPSLDVDNTTGFGPENIRVDAPVVGAQTYTIGVHNYYGAASTLATVRVYCGATLAGTYTRTITGSNTSAASTSDFWRVARVAFTSPTACTVTPVNDLITYRAATQGSP